MEREGRDFCDWTNSSSRTVNVRVSSGDKTRTSSRNVMAYLSEVPSQSPGRYLCTSGIRQPGYSMHRTNSEVIESI